MGEKEGGKVGAMGRLGEGRGGGGGRPRGGAVRCGPRSTDSSSSYAPDGQGREDIQRPCIFDSPLSLFPSPQSFASLFSLSAYVYMCVCVRIEGNVDNEKG